MTYTDRLTTLINRFNLNVRLAPAHEATLAVVSSEQNIPERVLFRANASGFADSNETFLFTAAVDWGGASNPLLAALPDTVEIDLLKDAECMSLVNLMQSEFLEQRCGANSVINRLGEILIVKILRAKIEAGSTQPGILAGLSNPRISRAIVAIHDQPGKNWSNENLAAIAGLSLSRFAEVFLSLVGQPPTSYLRSWRLTLARQDAVNGDRVGVIARRYGYTSPEGFARAFKKHFGDTPSALRAMHTHNFRIQNN